MVPVFAEFEMMMPASTESIASRAAWSGARPVVVPLATREATATVTVLVRSRSSTERVPLVERPAFVSGRVAAAELPEPMEIVGASWVPVMVMTRLSVSAPPKESVTVIG